MNSDEKIYRAIDNKVYHDWMNIRIYLDEYYVIIYKQTRKNKDKN